MSTSLGEGISLSVHAQAGTETLLNINFLSRHGILHDQSNAWRGGNWTTILQNPVSFVPLTLLRAFLTLSPNPHIRARIGCWFTSRLYIRPSIRHDCEGGIGIGGPWGMRAVEGPGFGCDAGDPVERLRVNGKDGGMLPRLGGMP